MIFNFRDRLLGSDADGQKQTRDLHAVRIHRPNGPSDYPNHFHSIGNTVFNFYPLDVFRLRALSELAVAKKPGKQFVTFLLLSNVSLFVFHTLEGMRSVFGDAASNARIR